MEKKNKRERTANNIKLSSGEKLLIWRRRLNWNQSKAASYFKISIFNFKLAEYDKPVGKFKYPTEEIILTPVEKCLIYRKRSGLKQFEVAKKLGICRDWFRQQETGKVSCAGLLEFWEKQ